MKLRIKTPGISIVHYALYLASIFLIVAPVYADCNLKQLPDAVQNWIHDEQSRMTRLYFNHNSKKIVELNWVDTSPYAPEKQKVFELESYWIPEKFVEVYKSSLENELPMLDSLMRQSKGRTEYRLFVHPDSAAHFKPQLETFPRDNSFCATATSSHRTVLIWSEKGEVQPFMAKLDLIFSPGEGKRKNSPVVEEVARSIGKNSILNSSQGQLPEDFAFTPEPFGLRSKTLNAGMIIRLLPKALLEEERLIPLYALIGDNGDERNEPLFLKMLKKSKQNPKEYLTEKLIRPLAYQWVAMAINAGIVPHIHGQNTLLVLDSEGLLTGRFVHRDVADFSVNLKYREAIGLHNPDLPFIAGLESEQSPTSAQDQFKLTLSSFSDVLELIEFKVAEWTLSPLGPLELNKTFRIELRNALEQRDRGSVGRAIPRSASAFAQLVIRFQERAIATHF